MTKENVSAKNTSVETNVMNVAKNTETIQNVMNVQPIILDFLIANNVVVLKKEVQVCHVIEKLEIANVMKITSENVVMNVKKGTMAILFAKVSTFNHKITVVNLQLLNM